MAVYQAILSNRGLMMAVGWGNSAKAKKIVMEKFALSALASPVFEVVIKAGKNSFFVASISQPFRPVPGIAICLLANYPA